jgi:hypothetical protein
LEIGGNQERTAWRMRNNLFVKNFFNPLKSCNFADVFCYADWVCMGVNYLIDAEIQ